MSRPEALQCEGHSWSNGMRRCGNRTRRRHPNGNGKPICHAHGGV